MRTYDVMFILSPEIGEEGAGTAVEEYRKLIREAGVTPEQDEHWGKRRLAYTIGRHRDGIYHCFRMACEATLIHELERRMKIAENVIRHIAVRIDEDLKRQAKIDKKKKPRTGPGAPPSYDSAPAQAQAQAQAPAVPVAAAPVAVPEPESTPEPAAE